MQESRSESVVLGLMQRTPVPPTLNLNAIIQPEMLMV